MNICVQTLDESEVKADAEEQEVEEEEEQSGGKRAGARFVHTPGLYVFDS